MRAAASRRSGRDGAVVGWAATLDDVGVGASSLVFAAA